MATRAGDVGATSRGRRSRFVERGRRGGLTEIQRARTIAALLEFLEDEPGMGRLLLVDVLGAGPVALERRTSTVEHLVDAVHEGRQEARRGAVPTRPLERTIP